MTFTIRNPLLSLIGSITWLAVLSPAAHAGGEVRAFGNWVAGCDNKAECAAIAYPETNASQEIAPVILRIGVDQTSLTGFRFEIIPQGAAAKGNRTIFVNCLRCDDKRKAVDLDMPGQTELRGQRLVLPELHGAQWLDALGRGGEITAFSEDGVVDVKIDTRHFLDALKFLIQLRGNLMRDALLSSRPPSLTSAPPMEERQRVYPAREIIPSGFPGIERLTRRCPADQQVQSYRQFALPGNANLWGVICLKGETLSHHWFQSSGPADLPAPLELPDGDRTSVIPGEQGFPESVFDFDFGILRARSGPDGKDDCGIQRAWGWDGKAWFLLERREMPACIGLLPADWLRTYASP